MIGKGDSNNQKFFFSKSKHESLRAEERSIYF